MNSEELNNLLGIKPRPGTSGEDLLIENWDEGDVGGDHSVEMGSTCFILDEWEWSVADTMMSESGPHRTGYEKSEQLADLFAMCFRQQPEMELECIDKRFQEFVKTTLESGDFRALHQSTKANRQLSEMAVKEFANQYAKLVKKDQVLEERFSKKTKSKDLQTKKDAQDLACQAAVIAALKAASEEVEVFEEAMQAFGCGKESANASTLDTAKLMQNFQKVKNNPQLRRICELAGRYRRMAQSKQRQKIIHGYDDMIGVELDGDVSRLLPVEMSKLAEPLLELDMMRRLVEKQAMCREYRGVQNEGKGPIVICVDESGSTQGDVVAQEKAFALSMYWIARHQRRWCWLVSFASRHQTDCNILIPPNKPEPAGLIDWLGHFYNGGTDLYVPFELIPSHWDKCPKGKTDMILITDGQVDLNPYTKQSFLEFKKREKVKLTTIYIGSQPGYSGPHEVSDEVHLVNSISVESDAVAKCMSI